MPTQPTVAMWEIRALATAVEVMGGDSEAFLSHVGVDRTRLEDAEARISHDVSARAWESVPRYANNDNFGLHLAMAWRVGAFDVLEYCARATATLGESLEKMLRYQRLLHEAADVQLKIDGDVARIERRLRGDWHVARAVSEFVIAQIVVSGRSCTGVDWEPREVWFRHPAPADTSEHEALFRAPIHFGAARDEIAFDAKLLDLPTQTADRRLGEVLERQVKEMLERLPAADTFSDRIRRRLIDSLRGGVPSVQLLAREVALSVRTFHRRLAEEGTSFQQLLDETRSELARRHVSSGQLPLAEVAFVLGFSDVSAFHRAFRRWTGQTPLEFRNGRGARSA